MVERYAQRSITQAYGELLVSVKLRLKAARDHLLNTAGHATEAAADLSRLWGKVATSAICAPALGVEQTNAERRLGCLDPIPRRSVGNIELLCRAPQ